LGQANPQHACTGRCSTKYNPAATTTAGQRAGRPPPGGSTWPPQDARCGSNTLEVRLGPATAPRPHPRRRYPAGADGNLGRQLGQMPGVRLQ
jgi:hypothetical protein